MIREGKITDKGLAMLTFAILLLGTFFLGGVHLHLIDTQTGTTGYFAGGDGSSSHPYIITSCQELQDMETELSAHYVLGNDIDCSETINWQPFADCSQWDGNQSECYDHRGSGCNWQDLSYTTNGLCEPIYGFRPIGDELNQFRGSLNGSGHRVINLHVGNPSNTISYAGLFGLVNNQYSKLTDFFLENETIYGEFSVGGVVAQLYNGTLERIGVTGKLYSDHFVNGGAVGGIHPNSNGHLKNVYVKSSIYPVDNLTGGLIGIPHINNVTNNSYFAGYISNAGSGGLFGDMSTQVNSFYDNQSAPNLAITTGQESHATMINKSFFINQGWDYTSTWVQTCYPELREFYQEPLIGFSLTSPLVGEIVNTTPLLAFNATVSSNDTCFVNCTLVLDGQETNNYQQKNINPHADFSFQANLSTDGTHTWAVSCTDDYGTTITSPSQDFVLNVSPRIKNISLYQLGNLHPKITLHNSLIIRGMFNKNFTNATLFQTNGTNSSSYYVGSGINTSSFPFNPPLNTTLVNDTISNTSFYIQTVSGTNEGFIPGRYVSFEHSPYILPGLGYNYINNVTNFGGGKFKIDLFNQQNILIGENVSVYQNSSPSFTFMKASLVLFPGNNTLRIWGSFLGVQGPVEEYHIYYDNKNPSINLSPSIITPNISLSNNKLNLSLKDNYQLNLSTFNLTIEGIGGTFFYTIQNATAMNEINAREPHQVNTQFNISNIPEGSYNLTAHIRDLSGRSRSQTITNFTIIRTLNSDITLQDEGTVTNNLYVYANWTVNSAPFLDGYNIALFDDTGSIVVPWETINSSSTNYTFAMNDYPQMQFGEGYYVHIKPFDIFGNEGGEESTDGILIQDGTAPYCSQAEIVSATAPYTNAQNSFPLRWTCEDNQTGIAQYEYAIGTQPYPQPGWDSVLPVTSTTSDDFTTGPLSLQDGQHYYVSVRAKNNDAYTPLWSTWISSPYIILDRENPQNVHLNYAVGPWTASSVNINYTLGNDTISGINTTNSELLYATAPLTHGQCGAFGSFDPSGLNLISGGWNTVSYTGLQAGKCYQFKLHVSDNAGNTEEVTYSALFNLSVDTTPPTPINILDEGFSTGNTNLHFSWTGGEDLDSGIHHYQYRLGTATNHSLLLDWQPNGLGTTIDLLNQPLVNGEVYYLEVSAINNFGLATNATSNGILYLDQTPPQPLAVVRVANDTTPNDYVDDALGVNWTEVSTYGESGLTCVWSNYDQYYADADNTTTFACPENTSNNGFYNCNVSGLTEGEHTIHVICRDSAGNAQTSATNKDITFIKEMQGPTINVSYPTENEIVPAVFTNINVDDTDASTITSLGYILVEQNSGATISGLYTTAQQPHMIIPVDLSSFSGTVTLTLTAEDAYNRTTTMVRTFIVNNNQPFVAVQNEAQPYGATNYIGNTFYTNDDFNYSIKGYFFTNLTLQVYDTTNNLIEEGTFLNASQAIEETIPRFFNTTNASTSTEGRYRLYTRAEDANGTVFEKNTTIIFDQTPPEYFNDTCDLTTGTIGNDTCVQPTGLYETTTPLNDYLILRDDVSLDENRINAGFHILGTWHTFNATPTTNGAIIPPNSKRYVVHPQGIFITNKTISNKWKIYDLAGNYIVVAKYVYVENHEPIVISTNISDGVVGQQYEENIFFSDEDPSQQQGGEFNCTVNDTRFDITYLNYGANNGICYLHNASSLLAGNYTLRIGVEDLDETNTTLSTIYKNFTLTMHSSTYVNMTFDTMGTLHVMLQPGGVQPSEETLTSSGSVQLFAQNDTEQNATITAEDLFVRMVDVNLSAEPQFTIRKVNPTWLTTQTGNNAFWEDYDVYSVFAVELENYTNGTFNIGFDRNILGLNTSIVPTILQYEDYNLSATNINERLNYSSLKEEATGTNIVREGNVDYMTTGNFSLFVYAERHGSTAPTGGSTGTGGSGSGSSGGSSGSSGGSSGGHSGGFSGGGGFYFPPSTTTQANCSDGIQNQNETGIDCGGQCAPCETSQQNATNGEQNGGQNTANSNQNAEGGHQTGIYTPPTQPTNNGKGAQTELPTTTTTKEKVAKTFIFIIVLFVVIGALVAFVIESRRKLSHEEALMSGAMGSGKLHPDDDVVHLSKYVRKQRAKGFDEDVIKRYLLKNGYTEENIDAAIGTTKKTSSIEKVKQYFQSYVQQGFDLEGLEEWLLDQGLDPAVVALAKEDVEEE